MTTENETLDGEETITLEFPREELYNLMMAAHLRDITLNQLINLALREHMIAEGWIPDGE